MVARSHALCVLRSFRQRHLGDALRWRQNLKIQPCVLAVSPIFGDAIVAGVTPRVSSRHASSCARHHQQNQSVKALVGMILTVSNGAEIDTQVGVIREAARPAAAQLREICSLPPMELFWRTKFERIGFHPVEPRRINLVEQINQTWSYLAALEAARVLLTKHPTAGAMRHLSARNPAKRLMPFSNLHCVGLSSAHQGCAVVNAMRNLVMLFITRILVTAIKAAVPTLNRM
jgi:hypothetical protein